jgi:hypothetical protein
MDVEASRAIRQAEVGAGKTMVERTEDTSQVSRGKIDRLHRTPAGFTTPVLDGRGLRDQWLARPAGQASLSGSCPSSRGFAPRFLQTPPRDDALALR